MADGTVFADVHAADLLSGTGLGFGDISVDDNGTLYGSANRLDGTPDIIFFTIDLTSIDLGGALPAAVPATIHPCPAGSTGCVGGELDPVADPVMQLSFGGEGTLFGHTGSLTFFNDLYYVSLVPATLGLRGKVLEDIAGGPFSDLSSFDPLCGCLVTLVCHVDQGGDGHFTLVKTESLVQNHLEHHPDCRQEDAIATGDADDFTECVCP